MASKTLHVGRTYRFTPGPDDDTAGALKKNGATWDLTGATVSILFTDPTGTQSEKTATITSASGGLCYYDNPTSLFTSALVGTWLRTWRVVQGSIDVILEEPIRFVVEA